MTRKSTKIDAWKIAHDLRHANTKEWEVRPDLKVTARGLDRLVDLAVGNERHPSFSDISWPIHVRTANVITMRELAYALLDAADYVEECNPSWAAGVPKTREQIAEKAKGFRVK
jgi:hypothetical protein